MLSISVLEGEWNVDLNGDGVVEEKRNRRSAAFSEGVETVASFWETFDEFLDAEDERVITEDGFELFGNDQGGSTFNRNVLIKIRKLFNGYEKFVQIYLAKCKKLPKIENRVIATNRRLLGAVDRYGKYLHEIEIEEERGVKRDEKGEKKSRKDGKRMGKLAKLV